LQSKVSDLHQKEEVLPPKKGENIISPTFHVFFKIWKIIDSNIHILLARGVLDNFWIFQGVRDAASMPSGLEGSL